MGTSQTLTALKSFAAGLLTSTIFNGSGQAITMPAAAGQFALVSQIPSTASFVDLSSAQTITGAKTFAPNALLVSDGTTSFKGTITATNPLTGNWTWSFPAGKSGTIAMLSDITGGGGAQLNVAQTWTALQTFGSNIAATSIQNTGVLTLPTSTDTLVGRATVDTLTNKTLTNPTYNLNTFLNASGNIITIPTASQNDTLLGQISTNNVQNKSLYDSNNAIINNADNTKSLKFSLGAQTTGTTLTLASNQTTSQTLNWPNISASDTVMTLGTAQTISAVKTFSAAPVISSITNTGTLTLPTTTGTLALTSQIPSLANYVDLTSAQTISGVKTFSAAPVISSITNTGTLTLPTTTGTLALVSQIPTNANYVDLTTNQTVAGQKTFTGSMTLNDVAIPASTYLGNSLQDATATVNDPVSSGLISQLSFNYLGTKTITATSATTYTSAATLHIPSAPVASTNATITTPSALQIDSGNLKMGTGRLTIAATQSAGTPSIAVGASSNDGIYSTGAGNVSIARAGIIGANFSSSGLAIYNSAGTFASTLSFAGSASYTLTMPNSTSTIAALGLAQTFSAAQTFSGQIINTKAGATAGGTAGIYSNPATTAFSGANNYFWNYFVAPPASASTTGSAANVYIAGASAGTASAGNYALQVAAGPTSIPAGTVGAPSLVFGANNTTGLYSDVANTVKCAISGANVSTTSSTGFTVSGKTTTTQLQVGTFSTINGIQTGLATCPTNITSGSSATNSVTFSVAFSTTPQLTATLQWSGGVLGQAGILTVSAISASGFSFIVYNPAGSTITSTLNVSWIAIG